MTWLQFAVFATSWCLSIAVSSPTTFNLFHAINDSSILRLQDSPDRELQWAQYERFLLSKTRTISLLLYFTANCDNNHNNGPHKNNREFYFQSKEENTTIQQFISPESESDTHYHEQLVNAAIKLAIMTLFSSKFSQFLMICTDIPLYSQMLHYHLISSTPSLLWIPERSSSTFQRYPHVETNYLDLSINGTLFTQKLQAEQTVDKQNKNFKVFQQNEELENNIAKEITTFVRSCQEKSGYFVDHRAQGGRFLPAVSVRSTDEVWSKLEMIPIVAVLAFAAFVVYENRDVVHGVICTRCFWFLVCSGVIFVALSGLFHSIIHRRAWYYFGQTHGFVFVYPSPQRQFVLEGLVNGTWSFWWSLAGMSISDVLPTLRSQLARDDLLRWSLLLVVISYAALNFAFLIKYRWLA